MPRPGVHGLRRRNGPLHALGQDSGDGYIRIAPAGLNVAMDDGSVRAFQVMDASELRGDLRRPYESDRGPDRESHSCHDASDGPQWDS